MIKRQLFYLFLPVLLVLLLLFEPRLSASTEEECDSLRSDYDRIFKECYKGECDGEKASYEADLVERDKVAQWYEGSLRTIENEESGIKGRELELTEAGERLKEVLGRAKEARERLIEKIRSFLDGSVKGQVGDVFINETPDDYRAKFESFLVAPDVVVYYRPAKMKVKTPDSEVAFEAFLRKALFGRGAIDGLIEEYEDRVLRVSRAKVALGDAEGALADSGERLKRAASASDEALERLKESEAALKLSEMDLEACMIFHKRPCEELEGAGREVDECSKRLEEEGK